MLLSRPAQYAIRAMTFLATREPGRRVGAREISIAENIPMPFLWKVLHTLTTRRLVRSFKGINGGYELALSATQIPLIQIVSVTDGRDFENACVLGLPQCDTRNPCPLHDQWDGIRTGMVRMLDDTSLADLARVVETKRTARKRR